MGTKPRDKTPISCQSVCAQHGHDVLDLHAVRFEVWPALVQLDEVVRHDKGNMRLVEPHLDTTAA